MALSHSGAAAAPRLRLYAADRDAGADAPRLRQVFDQLARLVLARQGRDAKTVRSYLESIDYWERLTDDPPVALVTSLVLADFATALEQQPGRRGERLSPYTAKKHLSQIRRVLRWATADGADDRDGEVYLERVPRVHLPRCPEGGAKEPLSFAQLAAVVRACDQATRPELPGVPPAAWWRALWTVAYYDGFRIGTLLALRYAWLRDGLWHVPAEATKGRRRPLRVPAHEASIGAVASIRSDRELVFPWPHCRRWLRAQCDRLFAAAGIDPRAHWGVKFHAARKLNATELTLADELGGAAQLSLGHSDGRVTREFYVAGHAQHEVLRRAKRRMRPLPPPQPGSGQQLPLF